MSNGFRKYDWAILAGLVVASFLFFQLAYSYHLFLKEQIQLFLFTSDHFLSYFDKPAWLACYLGDFLTQFFYLKGGGALVLSLLLGLEWIVVRTAISRLSQSAFSGLWALLPVAVDWSIHCNTLHPLSATIGFVLVPILFLIYSFIANKWLSYFVLVLFSLTGCWLAGSSFLLFPVLALPYDFHNQRAGCLKWLPAFLLIFSAPIVLRHHYLLTFLQSFVYPAFSLKYLLLPASVVLAVTLAFAFRRIELTYSKRIAGFITASFLFVLFAGVWTQANFKFEKILALDNETYFGNPDKVIELARKYNLKNNQAAYFTNMALAQKGLLAENLFDFYQPFSLGLIPPVTPEQNWQSIFVSNEVFYLIGDMNMAQHSAMLGNTFSPYQRSSRMMRRLAEINLATGDSAAATKYLRILSKTMFHCKWAEKQLTMLQSGKADNWLINKRKQIADTDRLRKSNDYLLSLRFLADQRPDNTMAVDYLLCYLLLNKDLKQFRENYDRFYLDLNRKVPKVYAEALLAQLVASGASQVEVMKYNIDAKIIKQFAEYTNEYDQSSGNINALNRKFARTYWLYYHFATMQKK
jgi:hypothetical protein